MTGEGWRKAREHKGMTLRALARDAGISAPFQSDVEHGRRKYARETEARVREVLGLPTQEDPAPRCVVCGGPLTEHRGTEYRGDPMHMIIGPGHEMQRTAIYAIWCPRCGLDYRHAPKERP